MRRVGEHPRRPSPRPAARRSRPPLPPLRRRRRPPRLRMRGHRWSVRRLARRSAQRPRRPWRARRRSRRATSSRTSRRRARSDRTRARSPPARARSSATTGGAGSTRSSSFTDTSARAPSCFRTWRWAVTAASFRATTRNTSRRSRSIRATWGSRRVERTRTSPSAGRPGTSSVTTRPNRARTCAFGSTRRSTSPTTFAS